MGWPKGKKRKGYVRKDGKPHAARGGYIHVKSVTNATIDVGKAEAGEIWGYKGTGAVTEPCPNCRYAYADGGYCSECGWMRVIQTQPYGTHQGRRF